MTPNERVSSKMLHVRWYNSNDGMTVCFCREFRLCLCCVPHPRFNVRNRIYIANNLTISAHLSALFHVRVAMLRCRAEHATKRANTIRRERFVVLPKMLFAARIRFLCWITMNFVRICRIEFVRCVSVSIMKFPWRWRLAIKCRTNLENPGTNLDRTQ